MAAGNTDALPANTNAGTGSRFRDAAHAARGVELALLEAPQMAVVPDFRDNYHLEDLDHHHQRGRSLLGVRRCAGCLHASNSAALSRMHVCALHSLIHTGPPSQVIAHRCLSRRWRRRFGRYRRHAQEVPAATASAQGGRTAAPHTPLTPCTRVCCDRWDRGGHWRGRGRARWPGNDRAVAHRRSRCGRLIQHDRRGRWCTSQRVRTRILYSQCLHRNYGVNISKRAPVYHQGRAKWVWGRLL